MFLPILYIVLVSTMGLFHCAAGVSLKLGNVLFIEAIALSKNITQCYQLVLSLIAVEIITLLLM